MFGKFLEKVPGIAEGGQNNQGRTARFEMREQTVGESFGNVGRAPRPVAVIRGRASQEGRVEYNQVELFVAYRCEQIALPHIDFPLQAVEHDVDCRAALRPRG